MILCTIFGQWLSVSIKVTILFQIILYTFYIVTVYNICIQNTITLQVQSLSTIAFVCGCVSSWVLFRKFYFRDQGHVVQWHYTSSKLFCMLGTCRKIAHIYTFTLHSPCTKSSPFLLALFWLATRAATFWSALIIIMFETAKCTAVSAIYYSFIVCTILEGCCIAYMCYVAISTIQITDCALCLFSFVSLSSDVLLQNS